MTTVVRSGSPDGATEQPALPRQADTAASTGLGAEFRIARAKKLIELRGPGIEPIAPQADPGEMPLAEVSANGRGPGAGLRGWWRGRIRPMLTEGSWSGTWTSPAPRWYVVHPVNQYR